MNWKQLLGAAAGLGLGALVCGGAAAETVTVGYQLIYNPWKVPIADNTFSKTTGWDVQYRQFDSGAKVIAAMASGDVQIALAGSSPIAAGASQGLDIQLVWIVEDIASAEALVARNGSGIDKVADLKGKKVGVPFVSTSHFHLLFALEHAGVPANEVDILNMQPPQLAAAWERGDIDAAFVWDPALGAIKKTGHVVITSGELSKLGKPTFDGLIVNKTWAEAHQEGLAKFIHTIAMADADYRDHKDAWTPELGAGQEDRGRGRRRGQGRAGRARALQFSEHGAAGVLRVARLRQGRRCHQGADLHVRVPQGAEEDPGRAARLYRLRDAEVRRGGDEAAIARPGPGAGPAVRCPQV